MIERDMDWNPFYTTIATSTATVLGLLFIAIQVNPKKFNIEQASPYRALALSTFNILFVVFFITAAFLIPSLDLKGKGACLVVAIWIGFFGTLRFWIPVLRGIYFGGAERNRQTLWHFIGPVLAYLFLGYITIQMFRGGIGDPFTSLGFAILGLFGAGIRNSWNLVIELLVQEK